MTVTVDELKAWQRAHIKAPARKHGTQWCHMMADRNNLDELHAMADKIGLRRSAFQNHPTLPHYDLTPFMRKKAIWNGAVEVTGREQVKRATATP